MLLKRNFGSLSSGEKSKIILLRGLLKNPKLMLFDEFGSSLDLKAKNKIQNYIREINNNGTTVLWVTHTISDATKLCNKYLLFDSGRLVTEAKIHSQDNIESVIYRHLMQ